MAGRLEGKVAIVTGAGSGEPDAGIGIGQAISVAFAREGAAVVIFDLDAERAGNTLAEAEQLGGTAVVAVGDVTSGADCAAVVDIAIERFGGLDILVNSAAIAKHAPITETDDALYDETLAVNLKGTFLASQKAIPALIARGGGSIVNIGSVAAVRDAGTGQAAYSASKAGQLGLTVELAGSYGRDNIRVNAVLPGMIATPMMLSSPRALEASSRLNLLGRLGAADDISAAVVFLCSDDAAYITGVTLPVDGGATMGMPASSFRRPAATSG
jgi:NAD(P)-dependent dehydrogenase (short-subunit alcohol dehydrogenase family)